MQWNECDLSAVTLSEHTAGDIRRGTGDIGPNRAGGYGLAGHIRTGSSSDRRVSSGYSCANCCDQCECGNCLR